MNNTVVHNAKMIASLGARCALVWWTLTVWCHCATSLGKEMLAALVNYRLRGISG